MKASAQAVQQALLHKGFTNKIVELPDHTRTAEEAAEAIGCNIEQIAKSIIFKMTSSNQALLIIASGANRIDETKVEEVIQEKIEIADADYVKRQTGFTIGGVAPIGHVQTLKVLLDEDLWQYKNIWAAAGHPKTVFSLTPGELLQMTKGKVIRVT